jgi:prepilin-type processing-associated H-X9-DG protein
MTLEEVDNGTFTNWADPSIFTGVSFERSEVTIGDVSDGTTNTYMVAEKYIDALRYTTGTDGADWESMYVGFANDNHRLTFISSNTAPRQDTPGLMLEDAFGSAHASGFNAVFCDGSVHSISYQIDRTVHAQLGNRRDGMSIPEDAF